MTPQACFSLHTRVCEDCDAKTGNPGLPSFPWGPERNPGFSSVTPPHSWLKRRKGFSTSEQGQPAFTHGSRRNLGSFCEKSLGYDKGKRPLQGRGGVLLRFRPPPLPRRLLPLAWECGTSLGQAVLRVPSEPWAPCPPWAPRSLPGVGMLGAVVCEGKGCSPLCC